MIIKKPYAFLIKHFRLIHGLLFVMLTYILAKSASIFTFFNDYVSNQSFIRITNLTAQYINYYIFLAIILASLLVVIIGGILKLKKKNINSYISIFIELIITFIYFIYFFTIFKELEINSLNIETVRNLRDISLIVLLPQFIFILVVLGRTLGFNIKQFDFKKDLEEIEISEADDDEVEVILGNNNYKYARFFRKLLRLTKYFILENKLFVVGCASILVLCTSLTIFMGINVYTVNYNENQQIIANSLFYKVNKSYITDKNIYGKFVKKDKMYIIVDIDVSNKYDEEYALTRDTFRLIVNGEMIHPSFTYEEEFIDLGTIYKPSKMLAGEDKNLIVVFEINKEDKLSDYVFRIKNYNEKQLGEITSRYKDIIIRPNNISNEKDIGKYELPIKLNFKETILQNTELIINDIQISKRFQENYNYCIKETCKEGVFIVSPTIGGKGENVILKMNTEIFIDKTDFTEQYIKTAGDILKYYGSIQYIVEGKIKNIDLDILETKYNSEQSTYIEVPSDIEKSIKIDLIINIRGKKYTINLLNMNKNLK